MPDLSQSAELQQLREQLAALTRRVYQLETLLEARSAQGSSPPPAASEVRAAPSAAPTPPHETEPPGHTPELLPIPLQPAAAMNAVVPKVLQGAWPPAQKTTTPKAPQHAASDASLESRIGGQWLNRIGIVAVLVGLSYFLKLAFENNWIGPATQVIIGMAAGVGLLFWSERFRAKNYVAFAYSLKAVGFGALYLSLWAASQYYHLVPSTVTFFGMVMVTMICAALAFRQNAELLAAFALVGGFLTPVLVSTGENHEIALFSYIVLLDLGSAWMVAIKKWQRLIYGSLAGTASMFVAWQARYYTPPQLVTTLVFLAIFFLLFIWIAARQQSEGLAAIVLGGAFWAPLLIFPTRTQEVELLLFIALLDITTVWLTLTRTWRRLLAGSFVATGLLFYYWAVMYYGPQQLSTTLIFASFFVLLYVAAPFIGSAPPRRQNGLELAILAPLNAAAYFTACYIMLEHDYRMPLVWLTLAAAALYFALLFPLRRREEPDVPLFGPLYLAIAIGFVTAAIPLKFGDHWMVLAWLVEAGALFWAAHRSKSLLLRVLGVVVLALGVGRLILVDSDATQTLIFNPRFGLYLVAVAALALLAFFASLEGGEENRLWAAAAILALNVVALLALNLEVRDYFRPAPGKAVSADEWRNVETVRAFTYSAVWMVYGSVLMLIGFRKKSAFLRWQAIVLLALTAAKVFFYDIFFLERGYRIAAFIVLGAILLAVSFFYQRAHMTAAE